MTYVKIFADSWRKLLGHSEAIEAAMLFVNAAGS
jgi:hypothetical protein